MAQFLIRLFGYDNEALVFFVCMVFAYMLNLEGFLFVLARAGIDIGWTNTIVDYAAVLFGIEALIAFAIYLLRQKGTKQLSFYSVIW